METVETLLRKGNIYSRQIEKFLENNHASAKANDDDFDLLKCFDEAKETYRRGIGISLETGCTYSGANLRLSFASLLSKVFMSDRISTDKYKDEAEAMLNWIIAHEGTIASHSVSKAREMKLQIENTDIIQVVKAMNVMPGYNYGGNWSDHWYECPNGHPYFIGECGGAHGESNCIECGARVGGSEHRLLGTNRPASSLISRARTAIPNL